MGRKKVKLFYSNDYDVWKTEVEVNKFIEDKDVIDIKVTSEGATNGHSFMIWVMYY